MNHRRSKTDGNIPKMEPGESQQQNAEMGNQAPISHSRVQQYQEMHLMHPVEQQQLNQNLQENLMQNNAFMSRQ